MTRYFTLSLFMLWTTSTWAADNHHDVEHTQIEDSVAIQSGIKTAQAQGGKIERHITLLGRLTVPAHNIASVTPRFAGIIENLNAHVGEYVSKGDVLATVQSNSTMRSYSVRAPISGTITERTANSGEYNSGTPIYALLDTTSLWAELTVFSSQSAAIAVGMSVHVINGNTRYDGTINVLLPPQTGLPYQIAVVNIDKPTPHWNPGQFITGEVDAEQINVPVRVEKRAIQMLDGHAVIFIKKQQSYWASPVELGAQDKDYVQIVSGLALGEEYVVENSYVIKADIEKSAASHAH